MRAACGVGGDTTASTAPMPSSCAVDGNEIVGWLPVERSQSDPSLLRSQGEVRLLCGEVAVRVCSLEERCPEGWA